MRCLAAVAAFLSGAAAAFAADVSAGLAISDAGFKQTFRLPDYADISGITWKGGSSFYVVRDGGNTSSNCCSIHMMTVPLDKNGCMCASPLMSPEVRLVGACDAEGIAYDPCSGNVWVSDEAGARIGEYDPATGRPTGRFAPVPSFVAKAFVGISRWRR